jgi:hypothetical protein
MRMPDLRVPDLSRRSTIALGAVVAGIVVILLALFGGSDSSDGATGDGGSGTKAGSIEPVEPINPDDPDARTPEDLKDGVNPLKRLADPFASSYGGNFRHKVTVRLSADAALQYGVRFRDGYEAEKIVSGGATITRTVKGGFPLVQVGMRTAPNSKRGSCSVSIDGVEVSSNATNKGLGVVVCTG